MSEQASFGNISGLDKRETLEMESERRPEIKGKADDWTLVDLQDIVEIKGGGTPSKSNENYWNGEIPWASVKDLTELTNPWKKGTEDYITKEGLEESASNLIPEKSVIIATRMTVGEPFINLEKMSINQDLKGLIPDTGKVNPGFLLYSLWKKDKFLKSLGRGTTVSGITTNDLKGLGIALPELTEQRRIASVLYNVDQAIQKTEEIIEQTQRVKKGLMQDLFTEGYFEHEGYQDIPSGKYPSDWEIVRAGNYLNLSNGDFLKSNKRDEIGTYPVYGGNGIMGYTNDWNVEKQTIVIGRVGAYCGVVHKTSERAWVTDNSIIVNQGDYDPYYLKTLLSWVNLNSYSEQSAQPRISQSTIENLRIPFPDKEEQEKISKVLRNFDVRIEREKEEKKKIQRLKKGLMQDLLTGKVRTKNKDIEVLPEVLEVEE